MGLYRFFRKVSFFFCFRVTCKYMGVLRLASQNIERFFWSVYPTANDSFLILLRNTMFAIHLSMLPSHPLADIPAYPQKTFGGAKEAIHHIMNSHT